MNFFKLFPTFQSEQAKIQIDKFVEKQNTEKRIIEEKAEFIAGCKTVENRTSVNKKELLDEKRKKESFRTTLKV